MEGVVQGYDTTNIVHGLFDSKAMSFILLFHKCIRKLLYDTLYRIEKLLTDCFTTRKREKLYLLNVLHVFTSFSVIVSTVMDERAKRACNNDSNQTVRSILIKLSTQDFGAKFQSNSLMGKIV